MARAKQLTVSHENRPGMVAEIAKVLGDAKVNILSCLTTTSGTEGVTHLVVDKVNKAEKALANAGLHRSRRALGRTPEHSWSTREVRPQTRREEHQHHHGLRDRRRGFQEDYCGSRCFRFRQGSRHSIAICRCEMRRVLCFNYLQNVPIFVARKSCSSTAARQPAGCELPSYEVAQLRYMKPTNSLQQAFCGNPMSTIS